MAQTDCTTLLMLEHPSGLLPRRRVCESGHELSHETSYWYPGFAVFGVVAAQGRGSDWC
jgi:hypothetical protein